MRKLLPLIIIVCLSGCAEHAGKKMTTVAFYNCENFFDTVHAEGKDDYEFTPTGKCHYTSEIYHEKVHNIATVLEKMADDPSPGGPALIGLAEVENNTVLNDLVAAPEIAERHYRYVWFDGPDRRGINTALLYDPARFIVVTAYPVHVDLSSVDSNGDTRDILHVRGVLQRDTVSVLINHWPARLGGQRESEPKRMTAATVDRKIVDSITSLHANEKIIVMGDLNDDPNNSSVTETLGANGDKRSLRPNELYNPWLDIYETGRGTLAYRGQWDLFDQIILSQNFLQPTKGHLCFEQARIFDKDFLVTHSGHFMGYPHRSFAGTRWLNGYSDHFPVLVYLSE